MHKLPPVLPLVVDDVEGLKPYWKMRLLVLLLQAQEDDLCLITPGLFDGYLHANSLWEFFQAEEK